MARIKNIELPKDKALYIGLTAIYGIGQSTRSNARTRKGRGKVVANKKKVGK